MQIHRFGTAAQLFDALGRFVVEAAAEATRLRGRFRFALAGGTTPEVLYRRLAEPAHAAAVDWSKVDVFFGDERCVPPDDVHSNYRMAKEALLDHVPATAVHRMDGQSDPEEAARRYAAALGQESLDLVLLGMGEDGHTASLFPGMIELGERDKLVVSVVGPKPPPRRLTLSLGAINRARAVALLVLGGGKAATLARVWRELGSSAQGTGSAEPILPAAMVRPEGGALHWFVDDAACALLPSV